MRRGKYRFDFYFVTFQNEPFYKIIFLFEMVYGILFPTMGFRLTDVSPTIFDQLTHLYWMNFFIVSVQKRVLYFSMRMCVFYFIDSNKIRIKICTTETVGSLLSGVKFKLRWFIGIEGRSPGEVIVIS